MQQLVDDAAHGAGDLVAVGRFETGEPVVESEQFGLDDVGGTLAQRGDRRGGQRLADVLAGLSLIADLGVGSEPEQAMRRACWRSRWPSVPG